MLSVTLEQLLATSSTPLSLTIRSSTNPDCCQQEQQTSVEQIQTACWEIIKTLSPQQCDILSSLFDMFLQKLPL